MLHFDLRGLDVSQQAKELLLVGIDVAIELELEQFVDELRLAQAARSTVLFRQNQKGFHKTLVVDVQNEIVSRTLDRQLQNVIQLSVKLELRCRQTD